MTIERNCPTCTGIIIGRTDKVFCSKECQNEHHRIARLETTVIQKQKVRKSIKRNYIVLRGLLGISTKSVYVHRDTLFKYGFNINHCLKRVRKNGKLYFVIRESQFRYLGKGNVEVTRTSNGPTYSIQFIRRWKIEFGANYDIVQGSNEVHEEARGRSIYYISLFNPSLSLATNKLFLKSYINFGNSKST